MTPNPETLKATIREIKKSLLNISVALIAIENVVPDLLECYHLAVKNKLIAPVTSDMRMQLLEIILPQLRKEVDGLNALVVNFVDTVD